MLAWCGCWLDGDPAEIEEELRRLHSTDSTLTHREDPRRSNRQDLTLLQAGLQGAVTLRRVGKSLRALLPIIPLTGLGSGTTAGFGRSATFCEIATPLAHRQA